MEIELIGAIKRDSMDMAGELQAMKRDNNFSAYQTGTMMNEFYADSWSCDFVDESLVSATTDHTMAMAMAMATGTGFSMPQMEPLFDVPYSEVYSTLNATSLAASETSVADQFSVPYEINNSGAIIVPQVQDQYEPMVDEEFIFLSNGVQVQHMEEDKYKSGCKLEMEQSPSEKHRADKSMGAGGQRRNGVKKVGGQPSKNLMAERRRRKRLNERLSMLRSIVPRISKMDRTSILADTIGYMKELLEKVGISKEQGEEDRTRAGLSVSNSLKELKPNEVHTQEFDVKMGETNTRVDICCMPTPGLLISTVSALEEMGLEIEQCVVSCFSDFSMQATCTQVSKEHGAEEIKQALFKNAGCEGFGLNAATQEWQICKDI